MDCAGSRKARGGAHGPLDAMEPIKEFSGMSNTDIPPVPPKVDTRPLVELITRLLPTLRHVITFASGFAVAVGALSTVDQATVLDALNHIGNDVKDILYYGGIITGTLMPIWAQLSARLLPMIRAIARRDPQIKIIASPAIAADTPANVLSSADVKVVAKEDIVLRPQG
jgi:hypothetical protein